MRLKRLDISGFKSFRDRSVLDFNTGINAVVGPNGCGKSNAVDAIRWVMGEQRVRVLRGKRMDDVIFNGSQDVAPLGMAEIVMTLANDEGPFPSPYAECSEVTVSRRIFRNGESEYAINKIPCRLIDVREFFMDTGIGVRTYSIVEQNSVADLVEAKPEERRQFIEEAAGIAKYKSRKESAQRKMEATRENLTRLRDIIREVKSGLSTLSKQVKRAEGYRALRKQIREGEINLSLQTYVALKESKDKLKIKMDRHMAEESDVRTSLKTLEASQESIKAEILAGETHLAAFQQKLYEIRNQISIKEQGIEFAKRRNADASARGQRSQREITLLTDRIGAADKEMATLKTKAQEAEDTIRDVALAVSQSSTEVEKFRKTDQALQREIDEKKITYIDIVTEKAKLKNAAVSLARAREEIARRAERSGRETDEYRVRLGELQQNLTRLTTALSSAGKSLEQIKKKRHQFSTETDTLKDEQKALEEAITGIREEISRKFSRLSSLHEFRDGHTWCSEGIKSIIKASRTDSHAALSRDAFLGFIADHIDAPREYETAVEAVLGEKLQYVVVKNHEEGLNAINYLKIKSLGRGSFVPLQVKSLRNGSPPSSHPDEGLRLRDRIGTTPDFKDIADYLFGDVLLIPDLHRGIALWRKNGFIGTFVTPEGDIISPHGVLTGGGGKEREVSLLRMKREIGELTKETDSLKERFTEMTERSGRAQILISQREEELLLMEGNIHSTEIKITGITKDKERIQGEIAFCEQRIRILDADRETFHSESEEIQAKIDRTSKDIISLESRESGMDGTMTAIQKEREALSANLKEREKRLTEKKVLLASLEERRNSAEKTAERLERDRSAIVREIEAKGRDISAANLEIGGLMEQIALEQDHAKRLYTELDAIEATLGDTKGAHQKKEGSLRERESELREARKNLEKMSSDANETEVELRSLDIQIGSLTKNIRERFSAELELFLPEFQRLTEQQIEQLGRQLAESRQALEDFGEVNLLATNEYEQIQERYNFLAAQESDLVSSLDALGKAIVRINRITRKRFAETFTAVNEHFRAVFSRIFPGGKGELHLTDEADLLEAGVDIDVQIPGKRAQNINLLSGGEKSLAAIALIFAILLHRPSPFVVLDEVDAALDDANISLFNSLLSDISARSQIIMITHNKRSMESARTLLGVTMQKQGISALVSVNFN